MKNIILKDHEILDMFRHLNVSIAVLDENMNILYMNERAKWFYKTVFQAENLLGEDVSICHQPIHIKNIKALFEQFHNGKPFSYFHADPPMIEGGQITTLHFPYKVDGQIKGIMEINVESSLTANGRCSYERAFDE